MEYREPVVMEFLIFLQSDKRIFDWQHRQADDAIRLYYFHYLSETSNVLSGISTVDIPGIIEETRRLIRLKHYSYSTERTYVQWIERFLAYALQTGNRKNIQDVLTEDLKNFLSHLAIKQKVSSSTQNQAFNALLFLFRNVLGKETSDLGSAVRAKRGQKLPVVFSIDEVKKLFANMTGKSLLIAELLYGTGMRLMELASLRVKDIDFDANTIFVRSEKGDKDRVTILPSTVKERLKEHLKEVKSLQGKGMPIDMERSFCQMF